MRTIAPGVHQISSYSIWPPEYVNAFVVDGDQGVTLIDTGLASTGPAVRCALRDIGRSISEVRLIVLTHCHVDHVGAAAALKQATGATVVASRADTPAIEGRAPVPPPPVVNRLALLARVFTLIPVGAAVRVDATIDQDGAAPVLPDDLSAIATPGHTPGHVCFHLDRAGGVLFAGDTAIATPWRSVVRGPMNVADPVLDESLRRLAVLQFEVAGFGHSPPLRRGAGTAFRRLVDRRLSTARATPSGGHRATSREHPAGLHVPIHRPQEQRR